MSAIERTPLLPVSLGGSSPLTLADGVKYFIFKSWLNTLLIFIPLTFLAGPLGLPQSIVFVFSLLAILPLAAILGDATEQCAILTGPTMGGLLNATFGNAEELIVSMLAIRKGKLDLATTSLVGSILSNSTLVMGCAFVAAGLKYRECIFSDTMAQISSSALVLACAAFIMPAAYQAVESGTSQTESNLLEVSRFSAVLLVIIYGLFLYFQLKSHSYLLTPNNNGVLEEEEEDEALSSPFVLSVATLVVTTVITSFVADYLVDSIDEFAVKFNISKPFIGLVVIPIAGNAAEHVTSIWMALKGKMELAIGVAIGSSNQIALGVLPILVLYAWIVGQPFGLFLGYLNTIALGISTLLVHLVLLDGKSNYLEGSLLVVLYLIFASIFWVSE